MAVEFALIAPVFLLLLIGGIVTAMAFSIGSGVQQLAAESARAAVAGLSDDERARIAKEFVTAHVGTYPFVVPQQLTVAASAVAGSTDAFQVALTYDLSRQVAVFASLLPFLPSQLHGSAVITVSNL